MSPTSPSSGTDLKWAPAPFDKPTADVILQSSDNVHFRVRKGILAEASSVFDELFTHATPAPNASLRCGDEMIDGVPVITMTETSSVLTFILHLYYPPFEVSDSLDTTEDAFGVMEATRKYMMPHAHTIAREQFGAFARNDAVRVYALASSRHLMEEKKIAAVATLEHRLTHSPLVELDGITGSKYCTLLRYRHACSVAATRVVQTEIGNIPPCPWLNMKSWFQPYQILQTTVPLTISRGKTVYAPHAFKEYMQAAASILRDKPCRDAIYDANLSHQLNQLVKESSFMCVRGEVANFETELANTVWEAVLKVDIEAV